MVDMNKVLLLFFSNDGQTSKIVSHVRERLEGVMPVEMCDIRAGAPQDLADYRAVLIGAAVRYGHFSSDLQSYVERHSRALNAMPSAFLGVCLTARKPEKRTPESNVYVRKFLAKTPWQPAMAAAVAGALLYPRYRWYDRWAIRFIMRITGGETDTSKEIVYTDWQQVEGLADDFAEQIKRAYPDMAIPVCA